MLQMVFDAELGAIFDVEESKKELKPSHLNKFDVVIVDDSIKLSSNLIKRRHFPFPCNSKLKFKEQAQRVLGST